MLKPLASLVILMSSLPLRAVRSIRRSRLRAAALRELVACERAYPMQLADAVGVSLQRLRWVMHGRLPSYRPQFSLVPLGLVRRRVVAGWEWYEVTALGREVAARLEVELVGAAGVRSRRG